MKKLTFPIRGIGSYRTLGPIVEAALEDPAWGVELVLGPITPSWSSKVYLNPTAENIPPRLLARGCHATAAHSADQLMAGLVEADAIVSDVGRAALIRDVLGTHVDARLRDEATGLLRKKLWCAVFDADHSVLPANHFDDADMIFWPSPYYLDWALREGLGIREALARRSLFVGYVKADNLKRSSARATRDKWRLDPERPVVLYIPDGYRLRKERAYISDWYIDVWCVDHRFERLARGIRSRRHPARIWRTLTDRRTHGRMIAQVRRFCDRNNAQLIMVPRRQKDWLGDIQFTTDELRAADRIVHEYQHYPQTMLRAMQVASLVICAYRSGAVLDAIATGVPYVTVGLPYYADSPANEVYNRRFDEEPGHRPGVTWVVAADEFIRSFAGRTLADFAINPAVLETVRAKYTGPAGGSDRILAAIGERLSARCSPKRESCQAEPV